ncbi:hypothetical protein FGB62_22g031 [Gracilaria domingensis]|nr:hypothetical protein FGB62_22g031 [Gracilaria domingensis]
MRQPLIRFRYAIEKARAAGASHPALRNSSDAAVGAAKVTSQPVAQTNIPSPPGVVRTSQRLDKAPQRAKISDEEMDAIMGAAELLTHVEMTFIAWWGSLTLSTGVVAMTLPTI